MSPQRVTVQSKVLSANDQVAAENRGWLDSRRAFAVNLISSPGSGKTTLLERTLDDLKPHLRVAVVAGDVQTRNDADRLVRHGVPVEAIETGGGCHLDARQVARALDGLSSTPLDLLLIENVGNLVCPSSFDLGESMKVVLMSVTEGEDKPLKYPAAFQRAGVFVVTKTDLVPYVDFSVEQAVAHALSVNPELLVFSTSARTGEGLAAWTGWLRKRVTGLQRSEGGARA